jgi:hypothetical protein
VIKEFVPAVQYLELEYDEYDWDVPFGASAESLGGFRYTCVRNKKHNQRITGGKEFISPMFTMKNTYRDSEPSESYDWLRCYECEFSMPHRCVLCAAEVSHSETGACSDCWDQQNARIVRQMRESSNA